MSRLILFVLCGIVGTPFTAWSQNGPLKFVATVPSQRLTGVVSIDISQDGKHLYAASYSAKTLSVFERDLITGQLTSRASYANENLLNGVTAVRLSPDNKWAIATAFRSKSAVLYSREPKTGKLEIVQEVLDGQGDAKLNFAIDAAWSPDSKFVYVIAANAAAVNVFQRTDKPGLELVEVEQGEDSNFQGARGIAVSPDGKFVYVASEVAGTLTVLNRDPKTGELDVLEVLKDGEAKAEGLSGAFSLAVSPDGKFVYYSSGRFRGNDVIGIFERQKDGKLKLVDELFNFTDQLQRFVGGNEIAISADGKHAYAVGSRSDSLVVFDRDPKTGKLTQTQFLVDNYQGVGAMKMPGGVGVSPDGQFIYVASEGSNAITIFQRPLAEPPANGNGE